MDKETNQQGAAVQSGGSVQWTEQEQRLIAEGVLRIRADMPEVYATIQRAAAKDKQVWRFVRLGLAGRPGFFWACEGKHTAGAPFAQLNRAVEISRLIARMGCAHVCMIRNHGDLGV